MSSPFGPMRLIVNPRAGRGAVKGALPGVLAALDKRGLVYDTVQTAHAGHATELAAAAVAEGVRFVVAVGGDGTVHEVVNGLFDGETLRHPDTVFGAIGAESGNNFVRTFGLDRDPAFIAKHLDGTVVLPLDVGVVEYRDLQGNTASRLFINVAEVGWGADVLRRVATLPRVMGRVGYLLSAWAAILGTQRQTTAVEIAHTTTEVPVVDVIVANCQFFASGSKVAPRALPDDGKLNVQIFTGQRSQMFLLTSKIYRGEHLPDPEISEYQSDIARLAPELPLSVSADGEVLGATPVSFRLLPKALRFKT